MAEDDSEIESLTDEELDALPISTVKDGEVVTYPNAEALESLRLVVKTTLSFSWSAMKKSAKS